MAKRILIISGDENRLLRIEEELSKSNKNIVNIGYDYDDEGGWCFARFKLDKIQTSDVIPVDYIKDWVFKTEIREKIICYDLRDMVEDWVKGK